MGGADWKRIGLGVATGGFSELERAGLGPSAALGGGGKGGKDGPAPPDFTGAAQAQADAATRLTREQTAANRPDQSGPFGSSTWSQGADGRWSQSTSLAPGLQGGADRLMAAISGQGPIGTGDQAREQAITSAYDQSASRLDPQWAQRETAIQSQLANQGLDAGSEAYGNAMGDFSRSRNDAYTSALSDAIRQGTAAQAVTFDQNMRSANLPYQQLGMMQGLGAQPGFVSAGSGQAPDYLGAAGLGYQGALNQYGIEQAGKNSQMAGLAALAPLVLKSSDERLKTNVERSMLEALPGVPFASWEWRHAPGTRHYGVIAQDMEKVRPDLVHFDSDGYRMVDYSFLAR